MKVKQVVDANFNSFYCGWGSLEFEDPNGNKISINISDDQILEMAEKLARKVKDIKQEREEKSNSGE